MNGVRLYFRYIAASTRSQLQYRASFILQTVGHCAMTAIEFIGIWALFDRFGARHADGEMERLRRHP